jgi:hypothetical protein
MDMQQQFLRTAQSETISFTTLGYIFPHYDFRTAIFPLWVALKNAGYRQSIGHALPLTIIDEGLTENLFRSALHLSFQEARDASAVLSAHGVHDEAMSSAMIRVLPVLQNNA